MRVAAGVRGLLLAATMLLAACQPPATPAPVRMPDEAMPAATAPNVLLLVADDLGYADLGVMGSEIRTPQLDALARAGVLLTDFHATPVCFATRASLLSGVDHHVAGFAAPGFFAVERNQRGHAAYAGRLAPGIRLLSQDLRDRGYHTYFTGKWDLGRAPEDAPQARGFERSWALLDGGASHFADGAGLVVFQRGAHYVEDGRPVEPPPDFYSSTFYTDQMLRYLRARPADDRPYFAYVAYTAPHWPLQVPDAWLDRYRGAYDAGYEQLHASRLDRMRRAGLVPATVPVQPRPPQVPAWSGLDGAARAALARRMEIYAAMVELLDTEIGRLLEGARAAGGRRDTIIVFLSDNGPEGNDIRRLPLNQWWLPLAFDSSVAQLGREGSYSWLGPGWAMASATPLRLYKAYPTEGGYRVPAIVAWQGRIEAGRREQAVLNVTDLNATLREITGLPPLAAATAGRSFGALLEDANAAAPNAGRSMPLELFGRRAVRRDQWKAVRFAPPLGAGRWQLYDMSSDPGEQQDLATGLPGILAPLVAAADRHAGEVGVVRPASGERGYADPDFH
jgi:arylsulfatase